MAPKTRGARKRKTEEGLEEEKAGELEAEKRGGSKPKQRGNKKYIGAHVSIQGKVFGLLSRLSYISIFRPQTLRFFCRGNLESCGVLH